MKKIGFVIVVIVFLVFAHGFIQNTLSLWQKQQLVSQAEEELARVQEENKELKSRLEIVSQPGFVEREARDKLFYVKPDEQIVLLPKTLEDSSKVKGSQTQAGLYWKQWIELFF